MTAKRHRGPVSVGLVGAVLTCVTCFAPATGARLALVGVARDEGDLEYLLLSVLGFS